MYVLTDNEFGEKFKSPPYADIEQLLSAARRMYELDDQAIADLRSHRTMQYEWMWGDKTGGSFAIAIEEL